MMSADGKIMVVAMVLAIIFVGISLFLFYLERKLSKMEKQMDELEKEVETEGIH
ncbi:MAG: CcmD family protein [Bacteroidales bacterium]